MISARETVFSFGALSDLLPPESAAFSLLKRSFVVADRTEPPYRSGGSRL